MTGLTPGQFASVMKPLNLMRDGLLLSCQVNEADDLRREHHVPGAPLVELDSGERTPNAPPIHLCADPTFWLNGNARLQSETPVLSFIFRGILRANHEPIFWIPSALNACVLFILFVRESKQAKILQCWPSLCNACLLDCFPDVDARSPTNVDAAKSAQKSGPALRRPTDKASSECLDFILTCEWSLTICVVKRRGRIQSSAGLNSVQTNLDCWLACLWFVSSCLCIFSFLCCFPLYSMPTFWLSLRICFGKIVFCNFARLQPSWSVFVICKLFCKVSCNVGWLHSSCSIFAFCKLFCKVLCMVGWLQSSYSVFVCCKLFLNL